MKLHEIHEKAAGQHGLVTRADLAHLDVSPKQRRTLVGRHALEPVGRRTFRVGGAPATAPSVLLAGCLDTGGFATEGSALWLHRIGSVRPPKRPVVLVTRPQYDYRSPIADVRTTNWLPADDVLEVEGIPCLSVARTLFSIAGGPDGSSDTLRDLVDEAIRDGKASDPWLWWMLERTRRRGRGGVARFERLLVDRAGGSVTESWLERELLRVLEVAGVPLPECQAKVRHEGAFVARVDFIYPELGIVIEVSGHRTHSTRAQRAADARRRNALQAAGLWVLEFTFEDLVKAPSYVVAEVTGARTRAVSRAA